MKRANFWGFLLVIFCWILFILMAQFEFLKGLDTRFGIHPFKLLLLLTLIAFLFSAVSLKAIHNWRTAFQSIVSVLLSLILLFILVMFIGFGEILS